MDKFIKVSIVVGNFPVIDQDPDFLSLLVNRNYPPNIPVKNLLVVVVGDLHDPVIDFISPPPTDYPILSRIEGLLKLDIEVSGPNNPPVHRSQDLNFLPFLQPEPVGYAILDQADDQFQDFLGVLLFDKVKVVEFVGLRLEIRDNPLVDFMGIDDNRTFFGLPENFIKLNDRGNPRVDDILEDAPRAD